MTKVNAGNDGQAAAMGGDIAGASGTTTSAPTATTVTDTGASFGTFTGHIVVVGGVYGVITSNTGTVATIDRWYTPNSPGGAAPSAPGSGTYVILPGQAPYWYMAITTDTANPVASDTSLPSEITTSGGGLIRKLATYAHTTGVASYSLAATYTVNGSDTGLPATIAKMGIFNTLTGATGRMQFETKLGTTGTVSAVGDQITITDTISN